MGGVSFAVVPKRFEAAVNTVSRAGISIPCIGRPWCTRRTPTGASPIDTASIVLAGGRRICIWFCTVLEPAEAVVGRQVIPGNGSTTFGPHHSDIVGVWPSQAGWRPSFGSGATS